jgi:hypothetical protein
MSAGASTAAGKVKRKAESPAKPDPAPMKPKEDEQEPEEKITVLHKKMAIRNVIYRKY